MTALKTTLPTLGFQPFDSHPYDLDRRTSERLIGLGAYQGRDALFDDLSVLCSELRHLLGDQPAALEALDDIDHAAQNACVAWQSVPPDACLPQASARATLAKADALASFLLDRDAETVLETLRDAHERACPDCDESSARCATGDLLHERCTARYWSNDALDTVILPRFTRLRHLLRAQEVPA